MIFTSAALAKAKRLSTSATLGVGMRGAIGGVAADAKIFDAERFEGGDERLVFRAEKMIAIRVRQHVLHFKTQADKIGSNGRAGCLRR